ncbi:MAG: hypothetical protein ACK6DS_02365 [Planctomycetota bacterium]
MNGWFPANWPLDVDSGSKIERVRLELVVPQEILARLPDVLLDVYTICDFHSFCGHSFSGHSPCHCQDS